MQASNIVSVTNTFAGRAPVALAPDDSVLVCCNRTTAMDIQVLLCHCNGYSGFGEVCCFVAIHLSVLCLVGSVNFLFGK